MFCRGNDSCKNNHLLQIAYMEAFWDGVLSHKKEGLLNVRGRHRAYRRGGKRVLYLGGRQSRETGFEELFGLVFMSWMLQVIG